MKNTFTLTILFLFVLSYAQYQFGNWALSENAGVSFVNDPPTFFDSSLGSDGFTSTATISDPQGNLLFYTDGSTVYNQQNQVMENGTDLNSIFGYQALIILPFEEEQLYYIYYVSHNVANSKLNLLYTKIDMSQNNGLGKVIEKNVLVVQELGKFLSAVKIPCENAYWLATYKRGNSRDPSNEVYMIKAEINGITEVVTNYLSVNITVVDQMTFSSNGEMFMFGDPVVGTNIRNFDMQTGFLGDILVQLPAEIHGVLGEFSTDSSKFYTLDGISMLDLIQVDLNLSTIEYINLEDYGLGMNNNFIDDMKLSVDGKIYISTNSTFSNSYLHRIENPNADIEDLQITLNALDFSPKILTGHLPQIISNMNVLPEINVIEDESQCHTYQFNVLYNQDIVNITWNFGDGNESTQINPNHTYTQSGFYEVAAEIENLCGDIKTLTTEINVQIPSFEDFETEFSICNGETVILQAPHGFDFYTWSNGISGESQNSIEVSASGIYHVTITESENCTYEIEYLVSSGTEPIISFIETTPNSIIVHTENGNNYQYSINGFIWQTSNEFNYLPPGTYTVYVRDGSCITNLEVAILFIPTLFTPNDDGINDTWNIRGLEIYPDSKVEIYDRYGKKIYSNIINGFEVWNGKDNQNNKVPTQDYWYIINVSNGDKITGHVTVKNRKNRY